MNEAEYAEALETAQAIVSMTAKISWGMSHSVARALIHADEELTAIRAREIEQFERAERYKDAHRNADEELKALREAVLDIDAHATPLGTSDDGFNEGGYIVSLGAMHRALGVVGHTFPDCRYCDPKSHDCGTVLGAINELTRLRQRVAELERGEQVSP